MICRIYVRAVLPIGCFYLIMTSKEKFCAFSLWSRFYSLKQEPYSDVQRASEKATSILLSKEQHFLLSSFLTRGSCFNHLVFKRRYAKYGSDLEPSQRRRRIVLFLRSQKNLFTSSLKTICDISYLSSNVSKQAPDRNSYPTHASIKKQMKSLNLTGVCQFENFANTDCTWITT